MADRNLDDRNLDHLNLHDRNQAGPISGSVICQFFGFFDGVSKDHYDRIVAKAPFDKCNLLILAFVHAMRNVRGDYTAQFNNGRDNHEPYQPGDSDADRVKLVVQTARQKNPNLSILISLGYDPDELANAASTPAAFADSVKWMVETYGLNGMDIDYEATEVSSGALLNLAQHLRTSLNQAQPPRKIVMTITPNTADGLDASVLNAFDYTMPQSYGDNPSFADEFKKILGSYAKIVYGILTEGTIHETDHPGKYYTAVVANHAAGYFGWRLDNDSLSPGAGAFPTFFNASEMWRLMHSIAAEDREAIAS